MTDAKDPMSGPIEPGQRAIRIEMTGAQLKERMEPFLQLLNQLQGEGHTADELLYAMMYANGWALGLRGVVLDLDGPIRMRLAPLADGYKNGHAAAIARVSGPAH